MNPFSAYFEQQILQADPVELIRMLYKRAITAVQDARRFMESGDIEQRSRAIGKACDILDELTGSLRVEAAPQIASQLQELYVYMQLRLVAANIHKSVEPLAEVMSLLSTLAEAWAQPPAGSPEHNRTAAAVWGGEPQPEQPYVPFSLQA